MDVISGVLHGTDHLSRSLSNTYGADVAHTADGTWELHQCLLIFFPLQTQSFGYNRRPEQGLKSSDKKVGYDVGMGMVPPAMNG